MSERTWLAATLALVAAAYLPVLGFGFVYDDGWTLSSNGFLRPGAFDLALLLSPEAAARHVPDAFRPTLVVFDALSYRLLGLRAWAHHALSVALHLGVCALLARLLTRLGAPLRLRLASVACFGLLAIHAEAVAVVSFREDLLAAALGLLAMLAALRLVAAERGAATLGWALASCLLAALACGAKLSAAALPALLPLLAWTRPWSGCRALARPRLGLALAALALGIALALVQTQLVYGDASPYGSDNPRVLATRIGLAPVLAASLQIHLLYLQQILVPLGLSPEYIDRGAGMLEAGTLLAAAGLLALVGLSVARARRWPLLAVAVLGWLVLCLPTSNLVGLPNMRADRFMYLPSLPPCIAIAAGLLATGDAVGEALAKRLPAGEASSLDLRPWLPLAAFLVLQGSFAVAASRVYVSNTTLWRTAARKAPSSARAQALLGIDRLERGRHAEGLAPEVAAAVAAQCRFAVELDPHYELPRVCLAELAAAQRRWGDAYTHYAAARSISVDRNDRLEASLAQLALDLPSSWLAARPELGSDRIALAERHLDRGLTAYPYSPQLHGAAGRIAHRLGQPERARALYRRARALAPERWEPVTWGLELALDLGDAAAAHRTWWAEQELLQRADPAVRRRLQLRLSSARHHPDFSLLHSLLDPGVFSDEP